MQLSNNNLFEAIIHSLQVYLVGNMNKPKVVDDTLTEHEFCFDLIKGFLYVNFNIRQEFDDEPKMLVERP